ncbi:hypothetical protein BDN71DRAFT_1509733 [Pleurotus eryngii]|uniref:Uncharacterized protein n=1 Tax=Pleurotus eryngii TaxID=5323 RepID=A0A9P6DE66_PLEER|nr:hypothetical protein BDN71DRAFT_1509733 [Pleurotus eryngii]
MLDHRPQADTEPKFNCVPSLTSFFLCWFVATTRLLVWLFYDNVSPVHLSNYPLRIFYHYEVPRPLSSLHRPSTPLASTRNPTARQEPSGYPVASLRICSPSKKLLAAPSTRTLASQRKEPAPRIAQFDGDHISPRTHLRRPPWQMSFREPKKQPERRFPRPQTQPSSDALDTATTPKKYLPPPTRDVLTINHSSSASPPSRLAHRFCRECSGGGNYPTYVTLIVTVAACPSRSLSMLHRPRQLSSSI